MLIDMGLIDQIGSAAASGLAGTVGSIPSAALNFGFGLLGQSSQNKAAKELMDYQWQNYNSPEAQVRSMAKAGLNPASLGEKGGFASPSPSLPGMPVQLDGISEVSNYIRSLADAKKAGADIDLVKANTKKAMAEIDGIKFQNSLIQEFGREKWTTELAQAYQNLVLSFQTEDQNEQQIAINKWKLASEKALSEANEHQRDILKKRLDNTDTQLRLENKLTEEKTKTEKATQSAQYASANASNAAAAKSKAETDYQKIVNDIKESGKVFELENLIRRYAAENKVNDASAEEAVTMLHRYQQLNDNDKNAAAKYLNYTFWFIKEQMPSLPVVPFLKLR